ncbi:DUF2292 domain-containing protein [Lutispora thermophila]|uniref:Uncharacterized small protein n=1 Tax=Lutispora thermophila DSM 19022 TaxID=1122184 RepID=A0A1M6D4K8_9FIRM|nr:DUF2292 domain-containing protein [Lutispora thermophila]SHI68190.1 Uncharacterized small protein [Lutispora thermophila DSM 19022]
MDKQLSNFELSEKEKKLIELIRKIEYGEIKVIIQDKLPIRIEEMKKSIKL